MIWSIVFWPGFAWQAYPCFVLLYMSEIWILIYIIDYFDCVCCWLSYALETFALCGWLGVKYQESVSQFKYHTEYILSEFKTKLKTFLFRQAFS